MIYLPFIVVILIGLYYYQVRKDQVNYLKRDGILTKGIIIDNGETNGKDFYRLGGNFNCPIIQFITNEGVEIIGKPIIGFTSQHEVVEQTEVNIFYNPENPNIFCIDLD